MWAQEWNNIYDLVEPYPSEPSLDVDKKLEAEHTGTRRRWSSTGERFFTSLGFDPLPHDVLGALALHAPARPRRRLPRERVGRRR